MASYLSICAIVKDENQFLREWIDFHLKIGVEHFHLFDNDSVVPVKSFLADLVDRGYVSVLEVHGYCQQVPAYDYCCREVAGHCRWIAMIDADEFLVPKRHNDLPTLLEDFKKDGGLAINWQCFGPDGRRTRPADGVLRSYTRRLDRMHPLNHHVKTVAQPEKVEKWIHTHYPAYVGSATSVNECHDPVYGAFSPPRVEVIQINHYMTRSLEDWQDKLRRGRADAPPEEQSRDPSVVDRMEVEATQTDLSAIRFLDSKQKS